MQDPDRGGLPVLPFASQAAWREWLVANHDTSKGLWLKLAKKGSGIDTVTYAEAVENGWGKEDFSAVTHVIEKRIGRKLSR